MKTFDEVTKALSICGRHPDCKGCPYENVSYPTEIANTCKDIMHYDALYYMQDRIGECQEENHPLTWKELRQMEGKPVWIEYIKGGKCIDAEWIVIKKVKETYIENSSGRFQADSLGWSWQAYRKERHEDA